MPENLEQTARINVLANLRTALGDSLALTKPVETKTPHSGKNNFTDTATASLKTSRQMQEKQAIQEIFPYGLPTCELVECLYHGSGCSALALCLARTVSRDGRAIAVIDSEQQFYPHTALALGIQEQQIVVLRPANSSDEIWALDQAIRCRGFAAVLWRGEKMHIRHLRRLQLACQKYNTLGLLLRPHSMASQFTAARTRLLVKSVKSTNSAATTQDVNRTISNMHSSMSQATPNNRSFFFFHRLRIKRLRGAHLAAGRGIELEIDYENGTFRQTVSLPVAS